MKRALAMICLMGCPASERPSVDAATPDDASEDAALEDVGGVADAGTEDGAPPLGCVCTPGPHTENIYVISDGGEIWLFDPATLDMSFVVGPVCAGAVPFSMGVDIDGVAWINLHESLSVLNLDLLNPGACTESPYVRTNPDFGLFGMSFASRSEDNSCSDLYVMTYSGDGAFDEGPGLGKLGVIDPLSGAIEEVASVDFDGGELTGTGDGRLFAIAGQEPLKLVEYDKLSGAVLSTTELEGVEKTNASAMAFFGGDIYIFVEALPPGCQPCLDDMCGQALTECRADEVCDDHLECVLATPVFSDECGGGLSAEMMSCITMCESCLAPGRARVSRVLRYDLDDSDGGGVTEVVDGAPIRVVGAASSPCVPVGPI